MCYHVCAAIIVFVENFFDFLIETNVNMLCIVICFLIRNSMQTDRQPRPEGVLNK